MHRPVALQQASFFGIHGGRICWSAVQPQLLDQPTIISGGTAMILVHILNPFGMAWLK
jgi:hypothetical protein